MERGDPLACSGRSTDAFRFWLPRPRAARRVKCGAAAILSKSRFPMGFQRLPMR